LSSFLALANIQTPAADRSFLFRQLGRIDIQETPIDPIQLKLKA
jgi:hypothetical protein